MRESLSLLYRELADYCDAKYTLLTQLTDPEKALPPLLARQQKAVDLITTCYQQLHMLSASRDNSHKRLTRAFQVALDLQEPISVSLHQPEEVQKLVEQSHAEAVIRWNAKIISARLRLLADTILYHQLPKRFHMEKPLSALEKIARQHPDNPVGNFCLYHFSRIARVLRTQKPLYTRDLMADRQRHLPLFPALINYLSFKSIALRTAGRFAVMLMFGSALALFFNIPKPYWILMTIMFVSQNGYSATRVRIQHRALGTFAGLLIAALRRTGIGHPAVHAGDHAGQLSGDTQILWLVDDWLYRYSCLFTAAAGAEWRAMPCSTPSIRLQANPALMGSI